MPGEPILNISAGFSRFGDSLYQGPGNLNQWKEKLGGDPEGDEYTISEASIDKKDRQIFLRLRNTRFVRLQNGSYEQYPIDIGTFPLTDVSESLLPKLLEDFKLLKSGR